MLWRVDDPPAIPAAGDNFVLTVRVTGTLGATSESVACDLQSVLSVSGMQATVSAVAREGVT
jgi:hypothetical protein